MTQANTKIATNAELSTKAASASKRVAPGLA